MPDVSSAAQIPDVPSIDSAVLESTEAVASTEKANGAKIEGVGKAGKDKTFRSFLLKASIRPRWKQPLMVNCLRAKFFGVHGGGC